MISVSVTSLSRTSGWSTVSASTSPSSSVTSLSRTSGWMVRMATAAAVFAVSVRRSQLPMRFGRRLEVGAADTRGPEPRRLETCGSELDRDLNAALNLARLVAGSSPETQNACGADVRPA